MEHHHHFLRTCYEEKIIPVGLGMKFNIGFQLYDDMLSKYIAENSFFIFNHIQHLAGDAFTVMNDLFKEFTRIKSDVRRRFPHRIVSQLFDRTRAFLANERRSLKIRRLTKLKVLLRKFQGHTFSSRQSNISVHLNQLDSFSWPNFGFSKNFYRFYPNHSFYDSSHHTDFSNFIDYNFSDCDKSKHYFNFSDNNISHPSLDQSFEAFHLQYSRSSRNRRFDKQCRKRSFRGGLGCSDRLHPMHYAIDLSCRNDTHIDEIRLLSKGPSFCPIPRDINWHKCRLDWQAFVHKVRWADYYFGRESTHNSNTSVTLLDDLGPFKIKRIVYVLR